MKKVVYSFLVAVTLISCEKQDTIDNVDCSKVNSNYSAIIKPIIDANCLSSGCHNAGSVNGDFTNHAGLKAVADKGKLQDRLINQRNMPPSQPLPLEDLKKIKCWISSGAPNN